MKKENDNKWEENKTKKKKNKQNEKMHEQKRNMGLGDVYYFRFSQISPNKSQEHRAKDVSRWALVASWGHLPGSEGV